MKTGKQESNWEVLEDSQTYSSDFFELYLVKEFLQISEQKV